MAVSASYHALFPDLLWNGEDFYSDFGLLLEGSTVSQVLPHRELTAQIEQLREKGLYVTVRRLAHRALMPGLVNAHSHAFQRVLRGRTEFPKEHGNQSEDFWSWRDLMYSAALELSPEEIEAVTRAVYVEMVKAGITLVGEFHYLHHQSDGTPYDDPDELSWRIIRAADSAGLNVTLLRTYYQRAGYRCPELEPGQRRFCDSGIEEYLAALERLSGRGHRIGVTPHSVRAVSRPDLETLSAYASSRALPFHIHANEQPKEIEESLEECGLRPIELLQEIGALSTRTTLVHAIHLNEREIESLGQHECFVCSCPTTERNLGDGVVPADRLLRAGVNFVIGSDSQAQITPWEEVRQLEYHLRLNALRRSILYASNREAGRSFLNQLTTYGRRSLGMPENTLTPGETADLIALDLNHLSLAGWTKTSLACDLVFGATPDVVTDVWVSGKETVTERFHSQEEQAVEDLRRVIQRLRA